MEESKPKTNKVPKVLKDRVVNSKSVTQSRVFRIGINPVLLIASIFLIGFIIVGAGNFSSGTQTVSLDRLVENLKQNNYAKLEVKDNGSIEATPKYIFQVTGKEYAKKSEREQKVQNGTDYVATSKLEELSLVNLYDKVRPYDFLENLSRLNFTGSQIGQLVVGNNYVLALGNGNSSDYIVKNVTESQLKAFFQDRKLNVENLGIQITYIRSSAKQVEFARYIEKNDQSGFVTVVDTGAEIVAIAKSSTITNDIANWTYAVTDGFVPYLESQGIELDKGNIEYRFVVVPSINWGDILSLVMIALAIVFAFFLLRSIQSGGSGLMKFGQTKARLLLGSKPDVTFADVAGIDEAKEELMEIVEFLRNPQKFLKLGARIPKGVLMVGSPGTGKTLLARAIAGEAQVPFFHTSGSEFEEMLVGAGASRVRDLFDKAKKASPSLIFIDEIDAVARKRGTTIQSSTTEQTLNQILTEMDGFEKNTNVIVIAATNRPDVLDPAIVRPGRFDRRVVIDLPDMEGRKQILAIHAKNKPLAKDVNLEKIAKRTVGFSGAELENTLNEAAIIAAKSGSAEITYADIEEAATKTTMGPAKKSRVRTENELRLVAVHEAGHAVVSKFIKDADPVHRVSIVSRGMAGGVTEFLPKNDENIITRTKLFSRIVVSLGGRAAEEIVLKDITTGASSDIEHATSIARRMVQKFGMSEKLGLIKYGESNELQYLGYGYGEQRDYSDTTAEMIDSEVRALVQKAYKEALEILQKHRAKLDELTELLLKKEVVEGEEFDGLFA